MSAAAGPEFSVIIATYQRPAELNECLRALAAQQTPYGFEVIVVDDGSRCDLSPVVEVWQGQLDLRFRRVPNQGPAGARNAGVELARGRWLAFTDDDCRPDPGWLAAFGAILERSPLALVGGRTESPFQESHCASVSQLIQDLAYQYLHGGSGGPAFFASNNMALPASEFRELGGFDRSFRTAEDRDLCDRWVISGRSLVYAPAALVYHARRMGLREFWRQHLNYGRGARRFYLAHRRRKPGSSTIRPGFYLWLYRAIFRLMLQHPHPFKLLGLTGVWLAANSSGYLMETFRREDHLVRS